MAVTMKQCATCASCTRRHRPTAMKKPSIPLTAGILLQPSPSSSSPSASSSPMGSSHEGAMAIMVMMLTLPRAGPHTPASGTYSWAGTTSPIVSGGEAASRRAAPSRPPRSTNPASWVPPPTVRSTFVPECHACASIATAVIPSFNSDAAHRCSVTHLTITITAGSVARGPTA